ncbi:MAG: vWA domain-containing protein [Candidatus Heimdallarchaeaceae archaeon]
MFSKRRIWFGFTILLVIFLIGTTFRTIASPPDDRSTDIPRIVSTENSLDNVTVNFITDLKSHREDGIPSILPGTDFSFSFNISNLSGTSLQDVRLFPEVNQYGEIPSNFNSTKVSLNSGETWLTPEYYVNVPLSESTISHPLDLVVVLDISGSMQDEIDVLKNDLIAVIQELNDTVSDIRVGLVFFGGPFEQQLQDPLNNDDLVYDLTTNLSTITQILSTTKAGRGYEPWGDALWLSQHQLSWREEAVNLVILITDEPCDSGEIIGDGPPNGEIPTDYDGHLLYELFENYTQDNIILCTIAASGSDSLTLKQLEVGASITKGTFLQIDGGEYHTSDLPVIIGQFIEKYSLELDLKITAHFSYLNSSDVRETRDFTFVVLLDDLPPEVNHWVYFTEDFLTEEKKINIKCEVKDVTGASYVEIYYKFDESVFWITSNATYIDRDIYLLTLPFTILNTKLFYQIYTKDWLGNEIITEIFEIELSIENTSTQVPIDFKTELYLSPNQLVSFNFIGNVVEDSYGLIFSENLQNSFDIIIADYNESSIIASSSNCLSKGFIVPATHLVKVQVIAQDFTDLVVTNSIETQLEFRANISKLLNFSNAVLIELNNDFDEEKERSIMADSQVVETAIYVFNASNWELIISGYSEVVLPNEHCFVLIYSIYHQGEVIISFNFEEDNKPFDHYYAAQTPGLTFALTIFALFALLIEKKRRTRG